MRKSTWDLDLLGLELLDLKDLGMDLELTGFDFQKSMSYSRELTAQGLTDEEAVPDLPETPVSMPGDLWLLGKHRLLCGDATSLSNYDLVLAGDMADMTFTDPPYGVDYEGKTQTEAQNPKRRSGRIPLRTFCGRPAKTYFNVTKGAVYICMSSSALHTLQKAFQEAGGHWSTFIIWAKNNFTLGRSDYQRQYEPILYGWKEGRSHYWRGGRDQGDVWFINRPQANPTPPDDEAGRAGVARHREQ